MTKHGATRAAVAAEQRARALARLRIIEEARRRGLRSTPRARDARLRPTPAKARTESTDLGN